jgi:hypothetical protein
LFTSPDALEMPSEIIDIQAAFGQPLHVQIRLGKPSNLKPWELLKSLLLRKIWVEVLVESQIIAEITKGHRNTDLEFEESQPQTRDGTTASQDDTAIQRQEAVIDLEALAGEVQKIISRYEKERAAGVYGKMAELEQKIHGLIQEAKAAIDPEALAEQVQKIISLRQEADAVRDGADRQDSGEPAALRPDAAPIGQGEPEALTAAQVTELVLKIIHAREAARAAQEQHQLRYPPGIGQAHFIASGPEGARYPQAPAQAVTVRRPPPVPMQAPLEQIPSRPGLNPVINNPPPKPPGAGG